MELYNKVFTEALEQNSKNEEKWTNFKKEVGDTSNCMNEFLKSCHIDIMVPIGKKAFIRGKLQHTNDILVSHGSNYFSLMSNSQANEIMKTRIVTCDEQLKRIKNEKKLFGEKVDLSIGEVFSKEEIIEEYNEEAEAEWRKKHRESVKRQKLNEAAERQEKKKLDDDLENLFDKYELLEEITGELDSLNQDEISDDVLSKLLSGDTNVAEDTKQDAQDSDEALDVKDTYILQKYEKNPDKVTVESNESELTKDTPPEGTKKKKKERRRVTFSSTEEVKVIIPAQEVHQEPTIQITFHHSPGKFHPDPPKENISEDEPAFAHPGDLHKFVSTIKQPETKSILKSKTSLKPKKSIKFKPADDNDQEEEDFDRYLKQQTIIGDVIEHKNDAISKPLKEVQENPQKVSRFKEMRSKVK